MRRIGVVTVGRSDYGILRPVLRAIADDPDLELLLFVTGSHLSDEHGATVTEIEADGFPIAERVELPLPDDGPATFVHGVATAMSGFARALDSRRPDVLLVLGDRIDLLAAVVAAVPLSIPVAHLHGGEVTEGAIDDSVRHAITKLSHLHFVATEEYGRRVAQLGEEPWRIRVTGGPSLDNVASIDDEAPRDLEGPFLLVTWHPVTLERDAADAQLTEVLAALDHVGMPVAFTHPNADPGRRAVVRAIDRYASKHPGTRVFTSLGTRGYFGLMRRAAAMVGNSSSGIAEAASFELPVVNIGSRQHGRIRAANIIDAEPVAADIEAAIRRAISPEFHKTLTGLANPYGDGRASERIVEHLKSVPLDKHLLRKRFEDVG